MKIYLGTNSATIPGVEIGNRNIIGAGTVVFRSVESDKTIVIGAKPRILDFKSKTKTKKQIISA